MMKKTAAVILSLFITVCSVSAVSASARGFFGVLAGDEYADERLAELDQVSEMIEEALTTDDGIVFELGQGCCVEDHVFIAYRISAATDLIVLHEGAPDGETEWNLVLEDWIPGDLSITGYPDVDRENEWLNGKGQRWLECPHCYIGEYLELDDGTHLDFIAGTEMRLEDGSVMGWRECLIPPEKTQDAVVFNLPVLSRRLIKYQDYSTFRENTGPECPYSISFTLRRFD